jgi:4-alpha-glucanotransferase
LRETGYAYWTTLLRSALRHAGALRLDHILGVVRQFWIPDGAPARDGAYVMFPTRDLLGILALEATEGGAVIIGEDLGTVPPEVPRILSDWRILGTRVLYFERQSDGGFRHANEYPVESLTTADTHDQVPLAGFLAGRDIDIRLQTGMTDDDAAGKARANHTLERRALAEMVRASGVELDPEAGDDALREAVLIALCRSPAALVAITLEDLTGETEPVNVPGVGEDAFPNWSRRLSRTVGELLASPDARRVLSACQEARQL